MHGAFTLVMAAAFHCCSTPPAQEAKTPEAATDALPPELEALPASEGRAAVFYTCSACHSIHLVTQQRLTGDQWDRLLDWMKEKQGMPALGMETRAKILDYLTQHFGPAADGGRKRRR